MAKSSLASLDYPYIRRKASKSVSLAPSAAAGAGRCLMRQLGLRCEVVSLTRLPPSRRRLVGAGRGRPRHSLLCVGEKFSKSIKTFEGTSRSCLHEVIEKFPSYTATTGSTSTRVSWTCAGSASLFYTLERKTQPRLKQRSVPLRSEACLYLAH